MIHRYPCLVALISLLSLNFFAQNVAAIAPDVSMRTTGEQAARLNEVSRILARSHDGHTASVNSFDLVRQTINRSQGAEPFFRRPVPLEAIEEVSRQLTRATGQPWSVQRTAATVDYIQTLMRESKVSSLETVQAKIDRSFQVERKPLHGNVAELAEARKRGMVLTKDTQSTTFDLTEDRLRPRSAQMKVFQDPGKGLSELQKDFTTAPKQARYGIMTQRELDVLVKRGKLRVRRLPSGERIYRPTAGPKGTILSARSLESAEVSQAYAKMGKLGALELRSGQLGWIRRLHVGLSRIAPIAKYLGLVATPMLGWEAYGESREAWAMFHDPTIRGTALPYLQAGVTTGRWGEWSTLGLGTAAQFGWLGEGGASVFGEAAGRWFLPVAIVTEGLIAGQAYHEYSTGLSSQREFYKRTTGPVVFTACTIGGATVGGIVGAALTWEAGGAGAWPGMKFGAEIGAVVSIPAKYVADSTLDQYYKEFDAKQEAEKERILRHHYGLAD